MVPDGVTKFLFYPGSRPAMKFNEPRIQISLVVISTGVKWPGREADYSLPFSVEIKSEWSCTLFPLYDVLAYTGTNVPSPFLGAFAKLSESDC